MTNQRKSKQDKSVPSFTNSNKSNEHAEDGHVTILGDSCTVPEEEKKISSGLSETEMPLNNIDDNQDCDISKTADGNTVILSVNENVQGDSETKFVTYQCHLCLFSSHSMQETLRHLARHYNSPMTNFPVTRVYLCFLCDRQFKFKQSLLRHLRECHNVGKMITTAKTSNDILMNCDKPFTVNDTFEESADRNIFLPAALETSLRDFQLVDKAVIDGNCEINSKLKCSNSSTLVENGACASEVKSENIVTCSCKFCGRGFPEMRNLRGHISRSHGVDGRVTINTEITVEEINLEQLESSQLIECEDKLIKAELENISKVDSYERKGGIIDKLIVNN